MSAVHKRLHYAMKKEFKILARVMHESLPQEYPYSVAGGDQSIMASDFDDRVDVIPVSNPNIFSQAQRIALAQSQLELAVQAPELHNTQEAFRRMYEALGVRDIDSVLKAPDVEQPLPKDPAQENVDAMDGIELKVFEGQDHDAHILAHLTFIASGMVQQLPSVIIALQKHVLEHVKFKAREQVTIQFMQTTQGRPASENEILQLESLIAQKIAEEMTAVRNLSQQIMGGGEVEGPDPLIALKEKELAIDEQKTLADIEKDQAKLDLEQQKLLERARQFNERIQSQEKQTMQRINASNMREDMRLRQKEGETP